MNRQQKQAAQFEQEIAVTVKDWEAHGKELAPQWITHALIEKHKNGLSRPNEHTPFFEHYVYKGLRQHVGAYIRDNYGDESEARKQNPDQFVLPGYEYVQRSYVVVRDEEEVAVPVGQLTDAEIDAKIQMLERRSSACAAHADELRRYKSERRAARQAS